jgi:hypothetical protein
VDANIRKPVHLILRQPVAVEHMHTGNEERDAKTRIPRGDGEGFQLAEIGAGAGDKEKGTGHEPLSMVPRHDMGRFNSGQVAKLRPVMDRREPKV